MSRRVTLLAFALLASTATSAQPYYNGLDADRPAREPGAMPGVRVGFGVGAYVYRGPDLLTGDVAFQDDVVATNLGVTAEVSAPLRDRLYGRLVGGVLNVGADDARADVTPGANPFLTSPTVLAEADLVYYLLRPGGGVAPYVFSGLSGLFATESGVGGVDRTALALPVGVGVEVGATRNLSLFAEASYRFGLTDVAGDGFVVRALARSPDVCDKKSPDFDEAACEAEGGTPIPTCEQDPSQDRCREVIDARDTVFDERFGSGLVLGGLRLGFAPAPPAPIPPPPVPPPAVAPVPPVVPEPPAVCDLVELNSVTFGYGSTSLDTRARRLLDENVGLLLESPACCVFVDGYVDESESDEFGTAGADRRARAVYGYYLSRGIDGDRLTVRDRGLAVPSCDKEDPGPGCRRNRRVESLPVDCERFRFLIDNPSYDPY